MKVLQVPDGAVLTQRKFIQNLIHKFQCDSLPPITCPIRMDPTDIQATEALEDATAYRKLVSKLNYLIDTRPDLSYSV